MRLGGIRCSDQYCRAVGGELVRVVDRCTDTVQDDKAGSGSAGGGPSHRQTTRSGGGYGGIGQRGLARPTRPDDDQYRAAATRRSVEKAFYRGKLATSADEFHRASVCACHRAPLPRVPGSGGTADQPRRR
ncbi:hypothetical protein Apa02nite_098450 [Actinoplanes palleronii]|uniref:Uncharacterized protein n=1 Tax=Actinoplanes palleronii TaxID=113570 RepID=A0ABQ4BST5_9ACTN|nr:hypothetical protein Apa02nite_098450 [Actinoplanes palleronii]